MAYSPVPGLMLAIKALAESALPEFDVRIGKPKDSSTRFLAIGVDSPFDDTLRGVSVTGNWAGSGATAGSASPRELRGDIRCVLWVENGDDDMEQAMSDASDAMDALIVAWSPDPSLGVANVGSTLIDADTAPEFWSDTDLGAVWVQVFSFTFYAYLSGVIA